MPLSIVIYVMWIINIWYGTKMDEMFIFKRVAAFSCLEITSATISLWLTYSSWYEF